MSEDFIADNSGIPTPPDSPNREPIKILLIGSPQVVKTSILNLYKRGVAVNAWSRLQPTSKPGEVMSILIQQIRIS